MRLSWTSVERSGDKEAVKFIAKKNQQILKKEEIIRKKLNGEVLDDNDIFHSLRGFTPTGRQKTMAINPQNMLRYAKYIL